MGRDDSIVSGRQAVEILRAEWRATAADGTSFEEWGKAALGAYMAAPDGLFERPVALSAPRRLDGVPRAALSGALSLGALLAAGTDFYDPTDGTYLIFDVLDCDAAAPAPRPELSGAGSIDVGGRTLAGFRIAEVPPDEALCALARHEEGGLGYSDLRSWWAWCPISERDEERASCYLRPTEDVLADVSRMVARGSFVPARREAVMAALAPGRAKAPGLGHVAHRAAEMDASRNVAAVRAR